MNKLSLFLLAIALTPASHPLFGEEDIQLQQLLSLDLSRPLEADR